mgnify:CR=1 FL=1
MQRQRVINILLGVQDFCPIIRRTEKLVAMKKIDLQKRCEEVMACYPPEFLRRALDYQYNKETKSSFAIEHVKPSASRKERFINLLEIAAHKDFCDKAHLINLQNRIADTRFWDRDWRTTQNYVGQTISHREQLIHYVGPKPSDLPNLMAGLFAARHGCCPPWLLPAI